MIQEITIPARNCICNKCRYQWVSIAERLPSHCQNRACRSREWNGKKEKKAPAPKPVIALPKPIRVRGGNDEF